MQIVKFDYNESSYLNISNLQTYDDKAREDILYYRNKNKKTKIDNLKYVRVCVFVGAYEQIDIKQ